MHARRSQLDGRLLRAAQVFARNFGGTISIVHADDPQDSRIGAVLRLAARYGVPAANSYVFPGQAIRVLPEAVWHVGADILLLGAVSRSRLGQPLMGQPFIGTTAERVIDRVECDVFVVKPVGYRSPVTRRRPRLPP
jgi:universal stress protein E